MPTRSSSVAGIHKPLIENKDIKLKVRVKELAPDVFAFLRHQDNIGEQVIKDSLSLVKNMKAAKRAGESQGKSGSFFFFSDDQNFIIKTMTESDLATFKRIFVEYSRHVCKYPNSLLARIYGVFTIEKDDMVPVHLILMGNTMKTKYLKRVFDLKGSMVNREVKFKPGEQPKPSSTLKDKNLLNYMKGADKFVNFNSRDQAEIVRQMKRDSEFLMSKNIMDYSLLFAVEYNPKSRRITEASHLRHQAKSMKETGHLTTNLASPSMERTLSSPAQASLRLPSKFEKTRHKFLSDNEDFIYHLSIIDYLQDFNTDKILENHFKTILNKKDKELISAVNPSLYQSRFIEFMADTVIVNWEDLKTA